MSKPVRIAIAGLGTVGTGVVRLLNTHGGDIASRIGCPIEIAGVSARSRTRDRDIDISSYAWHDDPVGLAREGEIDIFIELIGGEDGSPRNRQRDRRFGRRRHRV